VIAVGVYLAVAAGLRTWNDNQLVVRVRESLDDAVFARQDARSGGTAKQLLMEISGQMNRDLLVGAGGAALVGLGLGSGARRRLLRSPSALKGVARALLELWGAGEALGSAVASVVVLTFGYLVASELAGGQPPALAVLARAAGRTFNALVLIVRVVPGA
jgi:hypothetical protein